MNKKKKKRTQERVADLLGQNGVAGQRGKEKQKEEERNLGGLAHRVAEPLKK
jgi:hypothetical protein